MNAVVIEMVRGKDRKLYRAHPLSDAERARARWLAHALVCRDKLSIRAAQATLRESYGIPRSLGILARDLRRWSCPSCAERP